MPPAAASRPSRPRGGFCVFNDLAYAASRLVDEGRVGTVLILDCDVHQGDGTARILAERPELFTCSLRCRANPGAKGDKRSRHRDREGGR